MKSKVEWGVSPFHFIVEAYTQLYNKPCTIDLHPTYHADTGKYGSTMFPDDGSTPEIVLAADVSYQILIEILAHELAHVAAGKDVECADTDEQHGNAWQEAFDALHKRYCEINDMYFTKNSDRIKEDIQNESISS